MPDGVGCGLRGVLACLLLSGCAGLPIPEASPGGPSALGEALEQRLVFLALEQVGVPYRYGGASPGSGFDCSGLVQYLYREAAGVELPRTVAGLLALRLPKVPAGRMRAGDLLLFSTGEGQPHVGLHVGGRRFVHAPASGGSVRLEALEPYWSRHLTDVRRVPVAKR